MLTAMEINSEFAIKSFHPTKRWLLTICTRHTIIDQDSPSENCNQHVPQTDVTEVPEYIARTHSMSSLSSQN